jgi:hypothetical protein
LAKNENRGQARLSGSPSNSFCKYQPLKLAPVFIEKLPLNVIHRNSVAVDSGSWQKRVDVLNSGSCVLGRIGVVNDHSISAFLFSAVECFIGKLNQFLAVSDLLAQTGYTDTDRYTDILLLGGVAG